jgi:hypothetical protein
MTFTSPMARVAKPDAAPELVALNAELDFQRATLLSKLDGLTDEQARQRTVGSDTTLLGLVRHLTTIEQYWFVEGIAGLEEPYPYVDADEEDWDWDVDRSEGLQTDVDHYVALVERTRAITADLDLDVTVTTRHGRTLSHRRVLLGLVAEYARHNGHADVVRELIDGVTGD